MRSARLVARMFFIPLFAIAISAAAQQQESFAWVELTGDGLSARAIAHGDSCPIATIDGKPMPMTVRQPSGESFAVTSCQLAAPAGARMVVIDGQKLKLEARRTSRIVVIGDTGCRLKGDSVQDCNDPIKWPFRQVVQHAAAKHPDLVIHVGDYYYRETPCPDDRPGCKGSPHGDGWESWRADFFAPAESLLTEAPWVFARGNHEQCGRGADGWFRFLDAGGSPLTCPAAAAPFVVKLDALNLVVIDTADIDDKQSAASREASYEQQIPTAANKAKDETWIVTHKPLWAHELTNAYKSDSAAAAAADSVGASPAPAAPRPMDSVDMVVAGHVHFFATLDFSGSQTELRPAQLVVGDGGSSLDSADTRSGQMVIDGLPAKFTVKDTFGYLLLERGKHGWKGILYGTDDAVLTTCNLRGRHVTCGDASK